MASDGSLLFDTKLDPSGFNAGTVALGGLAKDMAEGAVKHIAGLGKAVIEVGAEFETSLAKLSTIADTNAVSIDQFSGSLKQLASETGQSASDLANVAYNAISAGVATEDAMSMVETATKLAVGGFTDADSALSVLTTALNSYGESAGTAEEIASSLIAVQNLGVTTVGELSNTMGKAIASGSAYGVNLSNLESAYISITKAGISTAEGTTYLSSMMKELGDSGSDVAKVLEEKTGKSFSQMMADGDSLADVLGVLYDSVDGDANALMNLWSSAEAGKASNAILNQGLDEFNKNLETVQNSTGATEEAFNTMSDTFEMKSARLTESAKNLGIGIYEGMQGCLGDLMDVALDAVSELSAGLEEGGVEGMLEAGAGLITNLALSIAENAPQMIAQGIDTISQFINSIVSQIPMFVTIGGHIISTLVSSLLANIPSILSSGASLISGLVSGLVSVLPSVLSTGMSLVIQLAGSIASQLPTILSSGIQIIGKLVAGLLQAVPQLIGAIPGIISRASQTFTSFNWASIGMQIINGIANGIRNAAGAIVSALGGVCGAAVDAAKKKLHINSPSKVFEDEVGVYIPQGIAVGVEKDNSVDEALEDINKKMLDAVDVSAFSRGIGLAMDDIDGSISGRVGGAGSDDESFGDKIDRLNDRIDELADELKDSNKRPIMTDMSIDGKTFARATHEYITEEQARESRLNDTIKGVT